jgi:hypothetical protein
MNWYVPPFAIGSELKAPASATMVWDAGSLFVHVTVDPVLTVRSAGLNAKPEIVTAFPPPDGAGVAAAGAAGAGEEQPAEKDANPSSRTQRSAGIKRREMAIRA